MICSFISWLIFVGMLLSLLHVLPFLTDPLVLQPNHTFHLHRFGMPLYTKNSYVLPSRPWSAQPPCLAIIILNIRADIHFDIPVFDFLVIITVIVIHCHH